MESVDITVGGMIIDFASVRQISEILAFQGNEFATLVAWNDRDGKRFSPLSQV